MKKIVSTVSLVLILLSLHAQKEGEAFGFSVSGSEPSMLRPYGIYAIVINIDRKADSSVEIKMAYAAWTNDTLFRISLFEYRDGDPVSKPFKTWDLTQKTGTLTFVRKKEDIDSLWIQLSDYVPGVFDNYWMEVQGTVFFIDRKSHEFKPPQPTNDY